MKILYFTRDYTSHDWRFLTALSNRGYQVSYLRLEKGKNQFEKRPIPEGVHSVSWAGGRDAINLTEYPRLIAPLRKVIREIQPDIIQAGPLHNAAFLVALVGFIPLVSMSWGYDLLHQVKVNPFWRNVIRYTLKRSAVMVGDCNTIRQLAVSYGMPDERIVTFPWGVDLSHFTPRNEASSVQYSPHDSDDVDLRSQLGWDDKHFVLLSTRNWESLYGVDVIAKAFVQAAPDCPQLRLLMLGSGSMDKKINNIFKIHDLMNRVHFPGQVGYNSLPEYYWAADVYISASHSDGTSISMLEAMASACPVLVSDIPGNREWVENGKNGWLFPDGNSLDLAQTITTLYHSRSELSNIAQEGRRIAEQRADWNKNFPHLLEAYEIALSDVC